MKAFIESTFDCPAELVWAEVQSSRLLLEIMWPVLKLVPPSGEQFPERWQERSTIAGRAVVFGLLPLGLHKLRFERIDQHRRQIQTREQNAFVRRWDHLISIRHTSDGRTLYSDEIEIHAGALTPLVWLFAQAFYRHRQRRWQKIARRLASAGVPAAAR